jgi:fatty aldehyde-generating acyl-ACP reductase
MNNFAFIIHPIDPKKDVSRKFPLLGKTLPVPAINFLSRFFPPLYISHITGCRSTGTGDEVEGWFVACPYTPATMLRLKQETVYKKVIQTGRLAEKMGARILGLGAFTSVVGDAGLTISRALDIPVTTGDSYTVHIAVDAVREGARVMGIQLKNATAAVVGATGAIGSVCAELLARDVGELILVGRRTDRLRRAQPSRLNQVKERAEAQGLGRVRVATDLELLSQADLVLTVTSALGAIIEPRHLKVGAVVCDVARPRDVSHQVVTQRDDVLVIEGGMVEVPGPVDFGFDFGFPPGKSYACMAETMILALEGRYESYTLGKSIKLERVEEIARLATKHGFRLAGFRSFERAVTEEQIDRIKTNAQRVRVKPVRS